MKKHECCEDSKDFIKYNGEKCSWALLLYSSPYGDMANDIDYCPWCGEKLEVDDV